MIHRAIAGSLERFLGIYIEHVAGLFPMWLAPKQAAILTVSDDAKEYGQKLFEQMKSMGFRVLLDDSSDKLAGKIKHVQGLKLPYMIIVGGREAQNDQVSLRLRGGEQVQGLSRQDVLDRFSKESQTPHYVW
jgi:threonyl-tRNA synthetase